MSRGFGRTLPLGVDIAADRVCIVAALRDRNGISVLEAVEERAEPGEGGGSDAPLSSAIARALGRMRTRERRCVIAPPSTDVVVRAFEPPPNMRARESLRAASFEAETWATWDQDDRTTSIQTPRISGEALLVGIARATSVERLVTVARCARLRPIAVDAPLCAWQRIAPTADAVLDLWRERAVLVVFGEPVGRVECFAARLSNDRLVAQSNGILASARGDGLRDTRRIEIYGPAERAADIASMFEREGYLAETLRIGSVENPIWAFAFALASWSLK